MSLYLTATDSEIVATCERNKKGLREFYARAYAWAESRGAEDGEFFPDSFVGTYSVRGLNFQPEGFGRWTKGDRHGCHWPYRTNVDELKALSELIFKEEPVPGLPGALHAPGYLMWPTPFVWNGAAWIRYNHMPEPSEREKIGPQWTECLASEYYTAYEAKER